MTETLHAGRPGPALPFALFLSASLALGSRGHGEEPALIPRASLLARRDKVQVQIDPTGRWVGWLDPTGPAGRVVVIEAEAPSRRHEVSAGRDVVAWAFASEPGNAVEVVRTPRGEALWRVPLPGVDELPVLLAEGDSIAFVATKLVDSTDVVVAMRSRDGGGDLCRVSLDGEVATIAETGAHDAWYVDGAGALRAARRRSLEETRFERRTPSGEWVQFSSLGPAEDPAAGVVSVSSGGERLWYVACEDGDDTAALRELDLETGAKRIVARDPEADLLAAGATIDPRSGAAQSVVSYRVRLLRHVLAPAVADDFAALGAALAGDVGIAGTSDDCARWLVRQMNGGPHDYHLYDTRSKRLTGLFGEVEGLQGAALAERHALLATSRDGLPLRADLYLPPGSDPDGDGEPSEPLPTVIFVHGGPWVGYEWNLWEVNRHFQLLANRGYAVLRAGFRGELGYGRRFVDAGDGEWGRRMQDDLTDLALAAERRGIAAAGRMALFGGSYGAYAVACGLASTDDVFTCGIALYGVYDLEAFLQGPLGETAFWRSRVGDPRTAEGRALLRERSPIHAAAQVDAPLLVTHGELDERVPIAQSDAFAQALVEAGAPVAYLVFPGEGHDYARPATWEGLWAAAEALLARCLGGRAEPAGDAVARSGARIRAGAELLGLTPAPADAPAEAPPPAGVTTEPIPLSHSVSAYATWSPDGSRIVFQSSAAGNFDLYEMRSDGTELRRLEASPADDITPVFSPDGERILFVSEREGNREIYVMDSRGGASVNLSRDPASDIHPWWSSDGGRILFSSNRAKVHDDDFDLFEMDADGGAVRQITRGPDVDTYASWSPDGRRIVTRRVVGGNSEVFVLDADGSNPRNLSNDPAAYDGWPCWSPDGRRIAFAGGGPDYGNKYLFLIDPDGARRTQLTFASAPGAFRYDTQPAFSPDGRWIAFTRYAPPMPFERAELYLVRVTGA